MTSPGAGGAFEAQVSITGQLIGTYHHLGDPLPLLPVVEYYGMELSPLILLSSLSWREVPRVVSFHSAGIWPASGGQSASFDLNQAGKIDR